MSNKLFLAGLFLAVGLIIKDVVDKNYTPALLLTLFVLACSYTFWYKKRVDKRYASSRLDRIMDRAVIFLRMNGQMVGMFAIALIIIGQLMHAREVSILALGILSLLLVMQVPSRPR